MFVFQEKEDSEKEKEGEKDGEKTEEEKKDGQQPPKKKVNTHHIMLTCICNKQLFEQHQEKTCLWGSKENMSSGVFDQARHKLGCTAFVFFICKITGFLMIWCICKQLLGSIYVYNFI